MIRSGDHALWDAELAAGRARADVAGLLPGPEAIARAGRILGVAMREHVRNMERAADAFARALGASSLPPDHLATRSPVARAPREPRPGRGYYLEALRGAASGEPVTTTALTRSDAEATFRRVSDELRAAAKLYPPARTIDVSRRREPPRP